MSRLLGLAVVAAMAGAVFGSGKSDLKNVMFFISDGAASNPFAGCPHAVLSRVNDR
jgi:hypothetical protein